MGEAHTDPGHSLGTRTTGTFTTTWDGEHNHKPGPSSWRALVFLELGLFSHRSVDTGGTDYWNEPLQNAGGHDHWAQAIVPDPGGTSGANTPDFGPAGMRCCT